MFSCLLLRPPPSASLRFRPFSRPFVSASPQPISSLSAPLPASMRAWAVHAFNSPLTLAQIPTPRIRRDDRQVLIRAASVNPLDVALCRGYGRQLLGLLTRVDSVLGSWPQSHNQSGSEQFPLVPGRDCSGEVVEVGRGVTEFEVGDQVIAVIPAHWPGSFADFVLAPTVGIAAKPSTLSHEDAASLPYVACTAWAALVKTARVRPNGAGGLRALIHGGAGGVGTMAIQMLRCWGADKVVATCSETKMDLVRELGAVPVDYHSATVREQLVAQGPFELILDCAPNSELTQWSDQLLGIWRNCLHISFNSPLLRDTDRYGLPVGAALAGAKLVCRNIAGPISKGGLYLPAFFAPNTECLNWVADAVQQGRLRPVIDQIFPFDELPNAFEKVGQMHGKGKTVVRY